MSADSLLKHGKDVGLENATGCFVETGEELSMKNRGLLREGDRLFLSDGVLIKNTGDLSHLCMLGAGAVGKSGKPNKHYFFFFSLCVGCVCVSL